MSKKLITYKIVNKSGIKLTAKHLAKNNRAGSSRIAR